MSHFEIVRLCALWDTPSANQKSIPPAEETIPTVVELINDPDVIDALAEEARTTALVGVRDPDLAGVSQMIEERAQQSADEARAELQKCIKTGQEIERSPRLDSVRNLRNKHLAHSLSETRREQKVDVLPMKSGDEVNLLQDSIPLVRALHLWVNGRDFLFDDSRENARRNAEELWKNCAFNIQSRGEPPAPRS
jgi:AbiU2